MGVASLVILLQFLAGLDGHVLGLFQGSLEIQWVDLGICLDRDDLGLDPKEYELESLLFPMLELHKNH